MVEKLVQPDILALVLEDGYSSLELMLQDMTSMTDKKTDDFRTLIWAYMKQQQRSPLGNYTHRSLQYSMTESNLGTGIPAVDRSLGIPEIPWLRLV